MSTLQSFLIKLGFDVSDLPAGGKAAQAALMGVANSAQQLASSGASVAPVLNNIAASAENAAAGLGLIIPGASRAAGSIGQIVTPAQAAANAMKAAYAAAGPLVAGVQGASGAFAAAAPAANLAAAGFQMAGTTAGGAGPPIELVGKSARMASDNLNMVPASSQRASAGFKQVAAAADIAANRSSFFNRTLSMAFAFSGGVAVTTLFGFLANALLGFNSRLEQARIAFTTLLGSAGMADQFIKKMEDFANRTPFDFQGVQDAAQRLMAMGFAANDVLPVLTAVGDAVAALGGDRDKLDRITLALGQMATAGRVNAQDMRQLTEAGIPAWQMLADGIGKTVAETRKLAEAGIIPASQALDILINGMETKYAGLMAKQARTTQGAFSTIRDVAIQTISGAVQPAFNLLSDLMVGIADFLINGGGRFVAPAIYGIAAAIGVVLIPRLIGLIATMEMATVAIGGLAIPIMPLIIAVTTLGIAWQDNFGGMQTALGPLLSGVGNLVKSVLQLVASSGLLVPVIVALAAIITTRFLVSLIATAASLAANAVLAIGFATELGALGAAATGAAPALYATATGLDAIGVGATAALGPVGLLVALLGLLAASLVTTSDEQRRMTDYQSRLATAQARGVPGSNVPYVPGQSLSAGAAQMAKDKEALAKAAGDISALDPMKDFENKFGAGSLKIQTEIKDLIGTFGTSMPGVRAAAANAGAAAMEDYAKGIRSALNLPVDAFKQLQDALAAELTPTQRIARDIGILASAELAAGLNSSNEATVAAAIALRKSAIEELDQLTNGAYSVGQSAGQAWQAGLRQSLENTGDTWSEMLRTTGAEEARAKWLDLTKVWSEQFAPSTSAAKAAYDKMVAGIKSGSISASEAATEFVTKFGNDIDAIKEVGSTAGASFMASVAQGIAQNADAPANAMKDLLSLEKAALEPGRQMALQIGFLTSKAYKDGMASQNPAIVAQTVAVANFVIESLSGASPLMRLAGRDAVLSYAAGMISADALRAIAISAAMVAYQAASASRNAEATSKALADLKAVQSGLIPSVNEANDAYKQWFASMQKGVGVTNDLKTAMADAKDKLKSAFAEIKSAARDYFDQVHEDNLKAIQDIKDLAYAQADAAAKAFEANITAERAARREAELRQALAIAQAKGDQAGIIEAQQNLVDFLQDQQLKKLQEAADAAKAIADKQAAEAKAAENKRYTDQIAAFNQELATLQRYMLRHPEEWKRMQAAVLSLLAKYGVTYISAGAELGSKFADGLRKAIGDAVSAAEAMAKAAAAAFNAKYKAEVNPPGNPVPSPPPEKTPPPGGKKPPQAAMGMWKLMEDQLVYAHAREMIVPPDTADLLRSIMGGGGRWQTLVPAPVSALGSGVGATSAGAAFGRPTEGSATGGGGTVIIMVDGQEFTRVTDERLAVRESLVTVLRPGG